MGRLRVVLLFATLILPHAFLTVEPVGAEPIPARPAIVRGNVWHLRNSVTSGFADNVFSYGRAGDRFLMGDWDGDGIRTPGVVRGNAWYLRNSNSSGFADIVFLYGRASDIPIAGDWNGDGVDTPGVSREHITFGGATPYVLIGQNTWHIRNTNTTGVADETFDFGGPGVVFAGDWDGDGTDGVGVRYRSTNRWVLTNDRETLIADFKYGLAGWFPVIGDWDGDGSESIGAVGEGNIWFLKNANESGISDFSFSYGRSTDSVSLVWGDNTG